MKSAPIAGRPDAVQAVMDTGPAAEDLGEVRLTTEPLDLAAARDRVGAPDDCGAVVAFTGVVRADRLAGTGERVVRLVFECYPEMALAEMERIRLQALERPGIRSVTIHHRHGAVEVGEDIVLVVVAGAHRRESFETAAWTMDEVKHRIPLWKQEVGSAGTRRWVDGDACGRHNASG